MTEQCKLARKVLAGCNVSNDDGKPDALSLSAKALPMPREVPSTHPLALGATEKPVWPWLAVLGALTIMVWYSRRQ